MYPTNWASVAIGPEMSVQGYRPPVTKQATHNAIPERTGALLLLQENLSVDIWIGDEPQSRIRLLFNSFLDIS